MYRDRDGLDKRFGAGARQDLPVAGRLLVRMRADDQGRLNTVIDHVSRLGRAGREGIANVHDDKRGAGASGMELIGAAP